LSNSTFRKVSLDRLSSPEQLDQKITVVSPIGWVAVVSLAVLILAGLSWGFLGTVYNRVSGSGMFIYGGGIVTLTASSGGQITYVDVSPGDFVHEGQVIARVSQDELARRIDWQWERLSALDAIRVDTLDFDVALLNSDIFREFSQIAGQIQSTRIQHEANRAEAEKNYQDVINQQMIQTQQVRTLEAHVASTERQIARYTELIRFQREADLEAARAQDRRLAAAGDAPSMYEQVRNRPIHDPNLAQMQAQHENLILQKYTLVRQSETMEYQIYEHARLIEFQREVELENARAHDRQRQAELDGPSLYQQIRNRPNYDPELLALQAQLDSYTAQRDEIWRQITILQNQLAFILPDSPEFIVLHNQHWDLWAQNAVVLRRIEAIEAQIVQHERMVAYQRRIELDNARAQDLQRAIAQDAPSAYEQVRNRPDFDAHLAQMQSQLENTNLQVILLSQQIVTLEQQIGQLEELLNYQREVELLNARLHDRQQEADRDIPSAYEQIANRPNFDLSLAQLQSQLESYRLQLIQARLQEAHLKSVNTGLFWSGYNLSGHQLAFLAEQLSNQIVIRRQDYLRELEDMMRDFSRYSVITASAGGIVSGLYIQRNDFVQAGSLIGRILREEDAGADFDVILYVPVDRGMQIREGMEVNISPATVKREEHGHIIGRVSSVSVNAVTQEHMMTILQNQQLVQMFGGEMAVLELRVELYRDEGTVSGYRWSTPRGAPINIGPGTISMGEIRISSQRPIDMVVPFIRRLFGGGGR